jgi:hypothetical protein
MARPLTRPAHLLSDSRGWHLYPLLRFLLKELGPEYLGWDSIALRLELEERWGQPGPVTWERVQAGRIMAGHDAFWLHMEPFENCSLALVGEIPVFSHMQPLEAESVCIAMHTASLISDREFSEEVLGYAVSCCLEDATWYFEPGSPLDVLTPSREWYDQQCHLNRPVNAVREYLNGRSQPFDDPTGEAQVQVNNVLSVRKVLAEYRKRIDDQQRELGVLS